MLKRSAQINGLTGLCITKLDVLDNLPELDLGIGYEFDGELLPLPGEGSMRPGDILIGIFSVLLVDTGVTLQAVVNRLRSNYPPITELRTTVIWSKGCSFLPGRLRGGKTTLQSVDSPALRGLRHHDAGEAIGQVEGVTGAAVCLTGGKGQFSPQVWLMRPFSLLNFLPLRITAGA